MDIFTPPHYGFETTKVSQSRRVFTKQNAGTIILSLPTSIGADCQYDFYNSNMDHLRTHVGALSREGAEEILTELGLWKSSVVRISDTFSFDTEG